MDHTIDTKTVPFETAFENVVERHYRGLYHFAMSLTHNESEAGDLTQQVFYLWATKGQAIRDATKVKSWLYTSLYREFLKGRRRNERFPHSELSAVEHELPAVTPSVINGMDSRTLMAAFEKVDEMYRAPLALFYFEDHSYQQIAEILGVPIGTVMSRIARGKAHLQKILSEDRRDAEGKIIPFPNAAPKEKRG